MRWQQLTYCFSCLVLSWDSKEMWGLHCHMDQRADRAKVPLGCCSLSCTCDTSPGPTLQFHVSDFPFVSRGIHQMYLLFEGEKMMQHQLHLLRLPLTVGTRFSNIHWTSNTHFRHALWWECGLWENWMCTIKQYFLCYVSINWSFENLPL